MKKWFLSLCALTALSFSVPGKTETVTLCDALFYENQVSLASHYEDGTITFDQLTILLNMAVSNYLECQMNSL